MYDASLQSLEEGIAQSAPQPAAELMQQADVVENRLGEVYKAAGVGEPTLLDGTSPTNQPPQVMAQTEKLVTMLQDLPPIVKDSIGYDGVFNTFLSAMMNGGDAQLAQTALDKAWAGAEDALKEPGLDAEAKGALQGLLEEIDSERGVGDNKRGESENQTVTYRRVQGGTPPKASWVRIIVDANGRIKINNKRADLNISIDGGEHANYFRNKRGNDTHTVTWQVPKWFDDLLRDNAVEQYGYRTNPENQGGVAPKIVDKGTPGLSYELSNPWLDWLEEYAINGNTEK
jgi:hypothetical protein